MLIFDSQIKFARELVAHWLHMRREGLVPFEEDIDPRAIVGLWPRIRILDISKPKTATVQFMDREARERYGCDVRKANLFDFVPSEHRSMADRARSLLIAVPCGVYYTFAASNDKTLRWKGETLVLPLRKKGFERPCLSIALTAETIAVGAIDPTARPPLRLDRLALEFVDIGAGAPSELGGRGGVRAR